MFKREEHPKVLVIASVDYGGGQDAGKTTSVLLSLDPTDKQYEVGHPALHDYH